MSRLFHSLVVCGAGLTTLSCGGRYADREQQTATGGAGSGGSSSLSQGGRSGQSAGGLSLGGFAGSVASGGIASGGSGVVLPAKLDHWVCAPDQLAGCVQGMHEGYPALGFQIREVCSTDATRPASPGDCAAGESFDCLLGFIEDRTVLFNCVCSNSSLVGKCACASLPSGYLRTDGPHYCDEQRSVCGCAYTGILK